MKNFLLLILLSAVLPAAVAAQTRDTLPPASTDEEDFSEYDNLGFADKAAKRYCNPKIFDLSPNRFISIGWDWQNRYEGTFSAVGQYTDGDSPIPAETADFRSTSGLRFSANIPVISKNSLVWQLGANFWNMNYTGSATAENPDAAQLANRLLDRGLVTSGINTTVFKPLGEKQFLLIQGSADLSGDYTLSEFQSLRYLRYSGALIWGKRPHDRLQWGVGAARTYRVGEMNYIPVVLYNWTARNRKWGTEILFPARAHVRRTFTPRSLLLAGYELEGQSYRIGSLSDNRSLEIRRGEMRARLEYQRQLRGFVWVAIQVGYRHNWSFNSDYLPDDGQEFFRGFFGDQRYAMINTLTNALYFNLSFNLVSP